MLNVRQKLFGRRKKAEVSLRRNSKQLCLYERFMMGFWVAITKTTAEKKINMFSLFLSLSLSPSVLCLSIFPLCLRFSLFSTYLVSLSLPFQSPSISLWSNRLSPSRTSSFSPSSTPLAFSVSLSLFLTVSSFSVSLPLAL